MTGNETRHRSIAPEASNGKLAKRLSAALIVIALVAGVGLRLARLGSLPPGLHQDEACDGYDAYSILLTGRDHHGNFMPLAMQAFNDYRMPLFQYSLVPLVAAFGLKPATVRLGAALWGIVDLFAITSLAWLMLGGPGAAAAALLCALSPWHLSFSRYGMGAITASPTTTLAMVCFFMWLRRRRDWWLLPAAAWFGLSLYSYAITKAFTPFLIALLAVLYRRELSAARLKAAAAAAIVILFALPQAVLLIEHTAAMQAQFENLSLFHAMAECLGCDPGIAAPSLFYQLLGFAANWIGYFTPSFLFLTGERGDHWQMVHPPGFGQLLPEQAPLIVLGLAAVLGPRRRRIALLLAGWLIFASLPAALTVPLGASGPDTSELPTPSVMLDISTVWHTPLTPSRLLAHADSRHGLLAMAPWILLSALGFAVLLDLTADTAVLKTTLVGLLFAGAAFHGVRFAYYYFHDFPAVAAPYFQYGIEQALRAIDKLDDGAGPIVITPRINQPYIYLLFFERYPPALFQRGPVVRFSGLFGPIIAFGRYRFVEPQRVYPMLNQGTLLFRGGDELPQDAAFSVRYPDGRVAYNVVVVK